MTKNEKALFAYLRAKVGSYINECLEDDQGHKSYEGTWELTVSYPSYFESDDFTSPPESFTVQLHCYLLGPARHYKWSGRTWEKALVNAKKDIETWIEGDAE